MGAKGEAAEKRERLLDALETGPPLVAAYAATMLGLDGDTSASPALLRRLETTSGGGLLDAVVEALGRLRERRAVPKLIELLRAHPDWRVRMHAAWSLGQIGDEEAADALRDTLRYDPHEYVRVRAREALAALGAPDEMGVL